MEVVSVSIGEVDSIGHRKKKIEMSSMLVLKLNLFIWVANY
jgi:hypothetical protein